MSELEFDVLDELYFVISFADLQQATTLSSSDLKAVLDSLFQKGWLKVFSSMSEELPEAEVRQDFDYEAHYYLASKAGLLAHNRR